MADEERKDSEEEKEVTEGEESPDEDKAAPPAKVARLLVIGLLAIVLGGGGFFGFKIVGARKADGPEAPKLGEIFELEEFLVNLADEKTFLRTQIALGMAEGVDTEEFHEELPRVRDAIVMTLTSKKPEDLTSTEGKIALKQEIIWILNRILNGEGGFPGPEENPFSADKGTDSPNNASDSGEQKEFKEEPTVGPVLEVYLTSFATQRY